MVWNFVVQIAIAVVLSVVAYALAPKPKPANRQMGRSPEIDPAQLEVPTGEAGRAIPVIFARQPKKSQRHTFYRQGAD